MSPEDRAFLQQRAAAETSSGRLLVIVHAVLFLVLLAIAATGSSARARGPLFVAALILLSGIGWTIYRRLLLRWIAQDLEGGRTFVAHVRVARVDRG